MKQPKQPKQRPIWKQNKPSEQLYQCLMGVEGWQTCIEEGIISQEKYQKKMREGITEIQELAYFIENPNEWRPFYQ